MSVKNYHFQHESSVLTDEHNDFYIFDVLAEGPEAISVVHGEKELDINYLPIQDQNAIKEKVEEHFDQELPDDWEVNFRNRHPRYSNEMTAIIRDINSRNSWRRK